MAPAIENNNYSQHNLMKCWFRFWLLIKLNDASNYISTLTWYLPREFVHIFPVSPPKIHLHHTQPPWPCVEEQGPVGSHIKWLIWWPYDALASPHPAPSLSKSHEHSPGNWSERLPTDGGNVSRSRFDPTSEKMLYIHHLHSSQFPKTWVLLSSYAQKHI